MNFCNFNLRHFLAKALIILYLAENDHTLSKTVLFAKCILCIFYLIVRLKILSFCIILSSCEDIFETKNIKSYALLY
ncbi:hypothetical protein DMC01_00095 [Campylobacter troglodytis]|nr:hypothetical protein DMC01_00095 [Campylobacter troglodytis]